MSEEVNEIFVHNSDGKFDFLNINKSATIEKSDNTNFLDSALIRNFRNTINSSDIFNKSNKLKEKFNLICVVMDRLDSAVNYLNTHANLPKTEEDFVCFLVYACMVKDAITKLHENVYHRKPSYITQKKYFCNVDHYGKMLFTEETCPTDDVFFEYLRSMAFAHPFETTKGRRPRLFMEDNEKQYCPWVIVHGSCVGIRVYTSSDKFVIEDITFAFENLKAYIKERYECISEFEKWANNEILLQDQEWSQHKVKRSEDIFETIYSIKEIYDERFLETYHIDCIEEYLKCEITVTENINNVSLYKKELEKAVIQICDALDTMDYESLDDATNLLHIYPRNAHQTLVYQLEKIFSYLDADSDCWDRQWGLTQAESFANQFAKKWVVFDFDKMSDSEIKLTVLTACYLEDKEQRTSHKV